MRRLPPPSTLFPYTTLFRSIDPPAEGATLITQHRVHPPPIFEPSTGGLMRPQPGQVQHGHTAVGPDARPLAERCAQHPAPLVESIDQSLEALTGAGLPLALGGARGGVLGAAPAPPAPQRCGKIGRAHV